MPSWILKHSFKFDAAHSLPSLGEDHKCARLHGHTWHVTVAIISHQLNSDGMVIDFARVKKAAQITVVKKFDHWNLNTVSNLENTTCEMLAQEIYRILQAELMRWRDVVAIRSVTVQETEGNEVTYYPHKA